MEVNTGFGLAPLKQEGKMFFLDPATEGYSRTIPKYETTYVERSVPRKYEEEIHTLIDKFLSEKGYIDEIR